MDINSEFYWTISILGAAILCAVTMIWLERRPRKGIEPSLIPTTPILYLSVLATVMSFVHLMNLFGMHTGR
jgi:hypothetical protein